MKSYIPFFFILFTILVTGCSLKYGMQTYDDSNIPEFTFKNASFKRYQKGAVQMELDAGKMEQYKDGKSLYAQNLSFTIKDENGNVTTTGTCGLLASNTDTEQYSLYDDISINNLKEEMEFLAHTLRWNGKTEQLTSNRTDIVTIKKNNTTIQGSGFSASGVTKSYSFTGVVTGSFITDNSEESPDEANEANNEEIFE